MLRWRIWGVFFSLSPRCALFGVTYLATFIALFFSCVPFAVALVTGSCMTNHSKTSPPGTATCILWLHRVAQAHGLCRGCSRPCVWERGRAQARRGRRSRCSFAHVTVSGPQFPTGRVRRLRFLNVCGFGSFHRADYNIYQFAFLIENDERGKERTVRGRERRNAGNGNGEGLYPDPRSDIPSPVSCAIFHVDQPWCNRREGTQGTEYQETGNVGGLVKTVQDNLILDFYSFGSKFTGVDVYFSCLF